MATLTMNFIGEHFKVYRVSMADGNRDWSKATSTTTTRPTPFSYSNNYSDNIIVADSGYKIIRVDFTEKVYEYEMASDFVNENYPNLEIDGVSPEYFFADYGVTIGSLKGVAFHTKITSNDSDLTWDIDVMTESSTPPTPVDKKWSLFPDGLPEHYHLQKAPYDNTSIDVSQLKYNSGDYLDDFFLAVDNGYKSEK